MQKQVTDDLDALLAALPVRVAEPLRRDSGRHDLLEVVMDLGRPPEARFPDREQTLDPGEVTQEDIAYVVARIGPFGEDNRAGIERTLHRISAIRNRQGRILGLTLRVGRAVFGTTHIIADLVQSGKSILLMGPPGVGKTTMLREVARVLADDMKKRVVIVDTSNEIAGDGDIPHPAIGHARRMQVATPAFQHQVMIEAVENHMPEVIIIDEIGTELEAAAARTIAERGVQLIGTAHGNTLSNLMMNPTLSDLIGGIQAVTLGDEEARRRGTRKSVLERKGPPTFDVVVEIQTWERLAVHADVARVVDDVLRGLPPMPEVRVLGESGEVRVEEPEPAAPPAEDEEGPRRVYPFGVSRQRLDQAVKAGSWPATLVDLPSEADVVVTMRSFYRRKPQLLRDAEAAGIPIYVLKNHTLGQMEHFLSSICRPQRKGDPLSKALREAEEAIATVLETQQPMALSPQKRYIRRLQHELAQRYQLSSESHGEEPRRRVRIFQRRGGDADEATASRGESG